MHRPMVDIDPHQGDAFSRIVLGEITIAGGTHMVIVSATDIGVVAVTGTQDR